MEMRIDVKLIPFNQSPRPVDVPFLQDVLPRDAEQGGLVRVAELCEELLMQAPVGKGMITAHLFDLIPDSVPDLSVVWIYTYQKDPDLSYSGSLLKTLDYAAH